MDKVNLNELALRCLSVALGRPVTVEENIVRGDCVDWDSLKHVELMFVVEEETGQILPPDELASITDVPSLEVALRRILEMT